MENDLGIWISALHCCRRSVKALAPAPSVLIPTSSVPGTPWALDQQGLEWVVGGVRSSGQAGIWPVVFATSAPSPGPGPSRCELNKHLSEARSAGTVPSSDG